MNYKDYFTQSEFLSLIPLILLMFPKAFYCQYRALAFPKQAF